MVRAARELGREPRLSDAGFPTDGDKLASPLSGFGEKASESFQFDLTPDEGRST